MRTFILLATTLLVGADRCAHQFPNKEAKAAFNKRVVLDFYRESYSDISKFEAGVRKYVIPVGYIQHNPNVADGVDALVDFQRGLFGNQTGPDVDFIAHIAADGDLVWVHEMDSLPDARQFKSVSLNLYRLECGKLVEHWDVIQFVDPNAVYANSHPFF